MDPVILYLTAKDKAQAVALTKALLEARLIACANIMEAHSLYRWKGAIEEAAECVIIAKSMRGKVAAISETVRTLHSYECPCVVALPITDGNPDFLKWIAEETA